MPYKDSERDRERKRRWWQNNRERIKKAKQDGTWHNRPRPTLIQSLAAEGETPSQGRVEGNIAYIPVGHGREAIVDLADFARVKNFRWCVYKKGLNSYALCSRNGRTIQMHQLLLCGWPGVEVDHKNGEGLDNRQRNLRIATKQQNLFNQQKRLGCASRYKGVARNPTVSARWRAYINCAGKRTYLGYFDTEEGAARAYDAKARALHGEFARLNFPVI